MINGNIRPYFLIPHPRASSISLLRQSKALTLSEIQLNDGLQSVPSLIHRDYAGRDGRQMNVADMLKFTQQSVRYMSLM